MSSEDSLVRCHGRELHAELDNLIINDPVKGSAMHKSDKKPRYDSESAADMFLRAMDYETEAKRLDCVAIGKETRAKEMLDSAAEDRARAREFHEDAARLKAIAAELSPRKGHESTESAEVPA